MKMSDNQERHLRPMASPYSPIEHFVSMFAGRMGYLDVLCEDMWGIMKDIEEKENNLDKKFEEVISTILQSPNCTSPRCEELIRIVASLHSSFLELKREKVRFENLKGETDRFTENMTQEGGESTPSSSIKEGLNI